MATAATEVIEMTANPLTPGEMRHFNALEKRIEAGLQTFREVGAALQEIRDRQFFRLRYPSFEAYCRDRWQIDRSRAYQLMSAAEVVHMLGAGASAEEIRNESTARELVPLANTDNPKLLQQVWKSAKEKAKQRGVAITADIVREARIEVFPMQANGHASYVERLTREAGRLRALYVEWLATGPDDADKRKVNAAIRGITKAT